MNLAVEPATDLIARIRDHGAHSFWAHAALLRTTEARAKFRSTVVVAAKIWVRQVSTPLERLLRELGVWHEDYYAVAIDAIKRGDSYEAVHELIQTISDYRHKHPDLWADVCRSIIEPCLGGSNGHAAVR